MKTFREFILENNNFLLEKFYLIFEKLNKTFDEDAHAKVWNYFIANPEYTEVRDAILNNDKKKAIELMQAEIQKARENSDHPLNFAKADDSEFALIGTGKNQRRNREASDEDPFNQEIEKAISGVGSLANQKKLRGSVEKGFPARKTGADKAELSQRWKSAGGSNTTPKSDIEIYNPDNQKDRRGISLKKEGGSQIASAEGGELRGTYQAAARAFTKRFHSDKSKEEKLKIEKEIIDAATRVAAINSLQKQAGDAGDASSVKKQKGKIRDSGQEILDKLHDKYPNLTRIVTQISTTGDEKFRGKNSPGSAGTILTGDEAKRSEEQPSARPRNALPKGEGRPGNTKIDNKSAEKKSNQQEPQQGPITYKEFQRKSRMAELKSKGVGNERDEKIALERERIEQEREQQNAEKRRARYAARAEQQSQQQVAQAQQGLEAANAEAQDASVPIYPDGQPVPRQYRKNVEIHMSVDQTSPTAQVNNQRRQQAQNKVVNAQNNLDNASANYQATVSAAQQQQSSQQPTASSQSQQQSTAAPTAPAQQPTQTLPPEQQQQQPQPTQTPPQEQPQQQQPAPEQKPKKKRQKPTDTAQRMNAAGTQKGFSDEG